MLSFSLVVYYVTTEKLIIKILVKYISTKLDSIGEMDRHSTNVKLCVDSTFDSYVLISYTGHTEVHQTILTRWDNHPTLVPMHLRNCNKHKHKLMRYIYTSTFFVS